MRTYRASSLGYSLESLVAGHLGYEPLSPPEWLQEKFDEGIALEPLVLAQLQDYGWELTTSQEEVNSEGDHQLEVLLEVIPGVATVRGHLDAKTENRVVEVKSMAEKSFETVNRLAWDTPGIVQKYKWQLSAYMLATGLPGVLVVCSKGKDGLKNLYYMFADEPFYTISDIANKLATAEEYIEKGLVPEGCKDFPCPYYYLHAPNESETESADIELETLMQSWLTWDQAEKAAKKAKDEHREKMLALTGDAAAAKVKGECGVVVETFWQDEKEYTVKQSGKWVTRVSGPRRKNA